MNTIKVNNLRLCFDMRNVCGNNLAKLTGGVDLHKTFEKFRNV